ncbi:MAG: hypothetical protein WC959_06730 [Kiritimatiellales bacterium]
MRVVIGKSLFMGAVLAALSVQAVALGVSVSSPEKVVIRAGFSEPVPYSPYVLGVNPHFTRRPYDFSHQECFRLTKESGATFMRFPGGTMANFINWDTGTFVDDKTVARIAPAFSGQVKDWRKDMENYHPHGETVDEFMDAQRGLGINNTSWVLNLLTGSPEQSAAWLQYCIDKEYPAEYWELGNEYYLNPYRSHYPTVDDFIADAKRHSQAMRAVKADVKLGVLASGFRHVKNENPEADDFWVTDNPNAQWNIAVSKESFYDAVVIHDYLVTPQLFAHLTETEAYTYLMSRNPVEFSKLIAYYQKLFPGKPLWLTEWNIHPIPFFTNLKNQGLSDQDRTKFIHTKTLAHGLYLADWLLHALKYPETVEMAHLHVLAAPFYWGMFYVQQPEEKHLDDPFVQTISFEVVKLFSEAFQSAGKLTVCEISGAPEMTGELDFGSESFPAVIGAAFPGEQKTALILLNKSLSDQLAEIRLNGFSGAKARLKVLTAPELIEGWGTVKKVETKYGVDSVFNGKYEVYEKEIAPASFTLPAHSLCLIIVESGDGQ